MKSEYAYICSAATRALIGLYDRPLAFFQSGDKYVSLALTLIWQLLQILGAYCLISE